MEIIRKTPGEIYAKSNTNAIVKFLSFLAIILVIAVAGICLYVVFGGVNKATYYLHESKEFYYSLQEENGKITGITFELFVDNQATSYEIPNTIVHDGERYPVTKIGAQAFTNHHQIGTITIPANVQTIAGDVSKEKGAFSGCINLTTLNLSNGIRNIESYAFKNCVKLEELEIPSSVQFIGAKAFLNNLQLTKVTLNSNGPGFDGHCFDNCYALTSLKLGKSVTNIHDKLKEAFGTAANLQIFEVDDANTKYKLDPATGCILGRDEENSGPYCNLVLGGACAKIPDGVTRIEEWAFGNRQGNADIFITETVTTINPHAFTSGIIYTSQETKPENWSTGDVPVRCSAKLVTFKQNFYSNDPMSKQKYIYREDPSGEDILPGFLFTEDNDHIFGKWSTPIEIDGEWISEAIYDAVASGTPDAADVSKLESLITKSEHYINFLEDDTAKRDKRLQFTFDFWEKFKSAYGEAESVLEKRDKGTARSYEVKNVIKNLSNYYLKIIDEGDPDYDANYRPTIEDLEENVDLDDETNLRNSLEKLKDMVALSLTNKTDYYTATEYTTTWTTLQAIQNLAMRYLNGIYEDNNGNQIVGKDTFITLRYSYEKLKANTTNLRDLITECENMDSQNYTADSWSEMTNKLAEARSITKYNLSISQVRIELLAIKENMVKNNLLTESDRADLNTWINVCEDLIKSDYTNPDKYVEIMNKVEDIKYRYRTGLIVTTDDVAREVSTISSYMYSNVLKPTQKTMQRNGGSLLNKNSLPFFIVAAVLFTLAVAAQAGAYSMKRKQRVKKYN